MAVDVPYPRSGVPAQPWLDRMRRDGETGRMTTKELERAHKAIPFRPFLLRLAGGRAIKVEHPEMMSYTPGGRITVVHKANGDFEILDLLLIESIEILTGKRGGRRAA